jgi:outer membrane immunogenic protein
MHKQILLAGVSLLALAGTAVSADMTMVRKAPVAAPVLPSWTGPYIGISGGIARLKTEADNPDNLTGPPLALSAPGFSTSKTGAILGIQGGYNWQAGQAVFGVEADISWTDTDKSYTDGTIHYQTEMNWLATFRGRLGWTPNNLTLFYVTGGAAVADIENRWGTNPPFFPNAFVVDSTRWGWTLGGGVEHMFAPNWTFKVEGLYVDFNDKSDTHVFGLTTYRSTFSNSAVIGRAGVNLKW